MKDLPPIVSACLHCPNARCKAFCPCCNEIPDVIALVKEGKGEEAAKLLYRTNPFPGWTSLLCDHDRQCRGHCIRGIKGEPIDFPAVEHALSEAYPFPYIAGDSNGKKIAIIGSGPASLSAATFLLEAGFAVEIFEKESQIGGAMRTGIPSFRFDKTALDQAYENLVKLGALFHLNTEVKPEQVAEFASTYDYVLLGMGAEKERRIAAPDAPNVLAALPLLRDINLYNDDHGLASCQNTIVMGGGNVAMDVSRTLVRLGAKVTLIYRRDETSMPAQRSEVLDAQNDGVVFRTLTNPASFQVGENGLLQSIQVVSMELGEPDESGRPSFHTVEGSEESLPCGAFIMAIGESSAMEEIAPEATRPSNVIPIGDFKYGARNIAAAIKDGREAAKAIIGH